MLPLHQSPIKAIRTGFEPVFSTVTGWRDKPLLQRTKYFKADSGIRTHDFCFTKAALWPSELCRQATPDYIHRLSAGWMRTSLGAAEGTHSTPNARRRLARA